jgi:HAD superfamily hydrolase (TIGR01490 family)
MSTAANASRAAAFFDIDGTLILSPSMERRLVRALVYRRTVPAINFVLWPLEFARLCRRGITYATHSNKIHFRKISIARARVLAQQLTSTAQVRFFPGALDRMVWHASQSHTIALISGTPQMLAECVARSLESALAQRKTATKILVSATALEEKAERWTGRIAGAAAFRRAKIAAVEAIASQLDVNLSASYAYGNSIHDRFMLEHVGHPVAVNSSMPLRWLARRRGWGILDWSFATMRSNLPMGPSPYLKNRKVETLG